MPLTTDPLRLTPAHPARPSLEPGRADPTAGANVFSVADIISRIRLLVEREFPSAVWVEGELSNCSYPASGHIYFSLVDERATDRGGTIHAAEGVPQQAGAATDRAGTILAGDRAGGILSGKGVSATDGLPTEGVRRATERVADRFGQRLVLPCAFFRGANQHLKFKLTDGLKVLCLGQVTTYEGRGQYQLKVLRVEPKGIGALQLAFEQLKKRLAAEGLFDEARKRPIPKLPNRIGLVTSTAGSAIHDMVSKLRGHFALIILPVKVQGDGAAQEIAQALDLANARAAAEVLIVGRGGGSVEDLWAFNEELVARAIARSRIPVISAVGHQDDWTIADYVADLRASTPTDAAKLLVNERQLLLDQVAEVIQRLVESTQAVLEEHSVTVDGLCHRLRLLHPLHQLEEYLRRSLQWQTNMVQSMSHALDREEQRLATLAGRLSALSPLAVLARGYSITFHLPDRHVLTDVTTVHPGDLLETRLAKGALTSTVTRTEPAGVV